MADRQPPVDADIPDHGWSPYDDIHRERIRAHTIWDPKGDSMERREWDDPDFMFTALEEVGECAKVFNELRTGAIDDVEARHCLREELIQTTAMFCAWVDAIDSVRVVAAPTSQENDDGR